MTEEQYRQLVECRSDMVATVTMSSGYNEQEVARRFVGKGLAGFIRKPYRLSVLQETIQGVLVAGENGEVA